MRLRINEGTVVVRDVLGAVSVEAASASLSMEDLGSGMNAKIDGGSILARRCSGSLVVGGRPEEVEFETIQGSVRLQLERARVRLQEVNGSVDATLKGGDITVENAKGQVNVKNPGGGVTLMGIPNKVNITGDWIDAEIPSGMGSQTQQFYTAELDVRLLLPQGEYDIKIEAEGSIDSDFPYEEVVPEDEKEGSQPGGEEGVGDSRASARSGPGREALSKTTRRKVTRAGRKPKIAITCRGDVQISTL
jgi:hypothetical protein